MVRPSRDSYTVLKIMKLPQCQRSSRRYRLTEIYRYLSIFTRLLLFSLLLISRNYHRFLLLLLLLSSLAQQVHVAAFGRPCSTTSITNIHNVLYLLLRSTSLCLLLQVLYPCRIALYGSISLQFRNHILWVDWKSASLKLLTYRFRFTSPRGLLS